MITLLLFVLVALVAFGFVCTVWAASGGPRWVRVVSAVTVGLAEVVGAAAKGSRRGTSNSAGGDSD
ncbi:hypothetical protein [Streptomyces sp. VRA16 Mangrove soil]|uniref:hypothetical protein n=1 Tax=Streptomyces sp. VRA16 Mangrove soil TaxID=2817434 RepID=UPI001A9E5154|nr:hypothetical protein [Streptomyces sp. VRA16 Mangrove soil]MBO1330668.1 hypothetical protein [Streptomyces sp. VRA16 Mangrove soil]